jgi:hypothetical protein
MKELWADGLALHESARQFGLLPNCRNQDVMGCEACTVTSPPMPAEVVTEIPWQ